MIAALPSYAFDILSMDQVRSLFSGNTVEGDYMEGRSHSVMNFYKEPFINYFADDGNVYSVQGETRKSGSWRVTGEGELCINWGDKKKCAPVYREGDHYKQYMKNNKGKIKWTNTYTTFTTGDTKSLQGR